MSFASLDFSDICAWVHPAEPHCSRPATGAGGWVPPFPLQSLLSPQQCFSGNKVKPCIQRESQCNLWNTSTWFKKCFQIHFEQRWKTVRTAVHLCFSAYVLLSRLCFIGDIWGTDLCASTGDVAMDGLVAAASLGFGTLQPGSVRHADLLPPSSPC